LHADVKNSKLVLKIKTRDLLNSFFCMIIQKLVMLITGLVGVKYCIRNCFSLNTNEGVMGKILVIHINEGVKL